MALITCVDCKGFVSTDAERCLKCGAKVLSKEEYDARVVASTKSFFKFMGKFVGGIVIIFLLYWIFNGVYSLFRGDWKKITVNGQTASIGNCRNDIERLEQLERSTASVNSAVPDLVVTKFSGNKVGACGANALVALESYFYYKDALTNMRTTMSSVMTRSQIETALSAEKKSFDRAESDYQAEIEKLRQLVK